MAVLKAHNSFLKANGKVLVKQDRFILHTICNNCQDNKDIPLVGDPSETLSNYTFDNPGYTFNGTPFMGKMYTIPEIEKLSAKVVFFTTTKHMALDFPGFEIFIDIINRVFIRANPNGSFQTNMTYFSHPNNIYIFQMGTGNNSGVQFDVDVIVEPDGTFKITNGTNFVNFKPTYIRNYFGPRFMDSGSTSSKMKLLELKVNK